MTAAHRPRASGRAREVVFWVHLASGLVAGLVVAVMSATGVAIAFEHEILAFFDRRVARVAAPDGEKRLPLDALVSSAAEKRPGFRPTLLLVPSDPTSALELRAGREGALYVDPYSGSVSDPRSGAAHEILHTLEEWHRWLGLEGRGQAVGKLVTGVCNAALVLLCLTGLWVWLPLLPAGRSAWRRRLWFRRGLEGPARDRSWHDVVGFWTLPVLALLAGTAVVFSFEWGHRLVFAAFGEEAPAARGPGMLAGPPVSLPDGPPGRAPLSLEAIHAAAAARHPGHEAIALPLARTAGPVRPLDVVVFEPAPFQTRGRVQLKVDPFTGDVLSTFGWADRSAGTRARVLIRFLHTGEALGWPGRIVAVAATAFSLLLVYTGFTLSWARFRRWRARRRRDLPASEEVRAAF